MHTLVTAHACISVWLLLEESLGCLRQAAGAHLNFCSRLCVYMVWQCVFICRACVCVCIYLARACRLCFPFCSVSANVGKTSVFNQGPGNCLVATVATALLIRPIGNDPSEPSMRLSPRFPVLGPSQREQQLGGTFSIPCVPKRETEPHGCRSPLG